MATDNCTQKAVVFWSAQLSTKRVGSFARNLVSKLCIVCGLLATTMTLTAQTPGISFTSVPPMGSNNFLTGIVTNVTPANYRVVVYIYVQGWWIKPTNAFPQTVIQSNGSWACNIVTGGADAYATKIVAYLVPQSYSPPLLNGATVLPPELENSLAKATAERTSPNAFHWCGYDWDVKTSGGFGFGPGPNFFSDSPQNVWVDSNGKLHLRVTYQNGRWNCAEIFLRRGLGYGTYRFFVDSIVDALDPNVVLGAFTYDDDPTSTSGHREIDVEISRWANSADITNAQFVIQPYTVPGNLTRWTIPAGGAPTTHSFTWTKGRVDFVAHNGTYAPPPASVPQMAAWSSTSASVPEPGNERVHINLWLFNGAAPKNGQEVEVAISRFVFIPERITAPTVRSVLLDGANSFRFQLTGTPQLWYSLETSGDLIHWMSLSSLIAPESNFELIDTSVGSATKRFYRAAIPGGQ